MLEKWDGLFFSIILHRECVSRAFERQLKSIQVHLFRSVVRVHLHIKQDATKQRVSHNLHTNTQKPIKIACSSVAKRYDMCNVVHTYGTE